MLQYAVSNGGAPTSSSDALDADAGVPLADSEEQPAAEEGKILLKLTKSNGKQYILLQHLISSC